MTWDIRWSNNLFKISMAPSAWMPSSGWMRPFRSNKVRVAPTRFLYFTHGHGDGIYVSKAPLNGTYKRMALTATYIKLKYPDAMDIRFLCRDAEHLAKLLKGAPVQSR